jgi:hypothetical protein
MNFASSILLYISRKYEMINILVYKSQQDAQVTEFILSEDCSTCFGFHYHPFSGAQNNCNCRQQYGYVHYYYIELTAFFAEYTLVNNCSFNLAYRHTFSVKFNSVCYSVMVTRYCSYSCFVLLKMGDSETRNM